MLQSYIKNITSGYRSNFTPPEIARLQHSCCNCQPPVTSRLQFAKFAAVFTAYDIGPNLQPIVHPARCCLCLSGALLAVMKMKRCSTTYWRQWLLLAGVSFSSSSPSTIGVVAVAPVDFTHFENVLLPQWVARFAVSPAPGNYSYDTLHQNAGATVYGSADVAHILAIANQLNATSTQAAEWASVLNSFSNSSGFFNAQPWETPCGFVPWHSSAYAIAALTLLGHQPTNAPAWAVDIAADPALWNSTFVSLLNATCSGCTIWNRAHKIAAIPASLMMTGLNNSYPSFMQWWSETFLSAYLDASNGYWCERPSWAPPEHVDCMGGAFHMDFVLSALGKPLYAPEAAFNSTISMQNVSTGLWNGDSTPQFIDLDGVYQIIRPAVQLGKPRALWSRARAACASFLTTAGAALNDPTILLGNQTSHQYGASTHNLAGAVAGVAECAKWFPDMVITQRPWIQTLDFAPYV